MSWTEWQEIQPEDIEVQEDDSEVVATGKNLIDYVLDLDDKSSEFKQGWVEAIEQMMMELEENPYKEQDGVTN